MDELTYTFSKALKKEISAYFKGQVIISGSGDDLVINLTHDTFGKEYHEHDIPYKVCHGMTAIYLADKILMDAKNVILKSIFKKIPK